MYVRLAFSVAAHLEPEILLVDEVLAVGDAEFQRRCLGRMEDFGELRPHGALRLAQHAGDRAALRPHDPARRRPDRPSTGRAHEIVAYYLQSGHGHGLEPRVARPDDGARERARATALRARVVQDDGDARTRSTSAARSGSRSAFRVLARRAAGRSRRSRSSISRASRLQRAGHRARAGTSRAAGRLRLDRLDPRRTC